METPIKEKWLGNKDVVAELIDFKVLKFAAAGLLDSGKADVICLYKKKPGQSDDDQKRLTVYGETNAVFDRVRQIIDRVSPKNKERILSKFIDIWTKTGITHRQPKDLLVNKLNTYGLNSKKFAELSGKKVPTVYHHTSGNREITKEVAEDYAAKLNCDPVDLMYEKKSVAIWSKVNLLGHTQLDINYKPGRLYPYGTLLSLENAIVPRDYWREDIKAIKIDSRGSMYHNQIAFYYRAAERSDNVINKLCIVGVEVQTVDEVLDPVTDEQYYFGLYEEVRGQSNLVNPDPFVGQEDKFLLKNFTPTFIAPVVLMANPEMVVDQTNLTHKIPDAALVRKEETLQYELTQKLQEIGKLKRELEERNITQSQIKQLQREQHELEEEMRKIMFNVAQTTDKIRNEVQKKSSGIMSTLFGKEKEVMRKIEEEKNKMIINLHEEAKLRASKK